MTIDLTKIDVPFGELDRETQCRLVASHVLDGDTIEAFCASDGWHDVYSPDWGSPLVYHYIFRLKPKPLTKPSINWDHVAEGLGWLARDENGNAFLYSVEPTCYAEGYWTSYKGHVPRAAHFSSFAPGTCDWKDSLVRRPEKDKP